MNYILIGIIVLLSFVIFLQNRKVDGVLIINTNDPDKDIFRFEFNDLNHIDKKRYLRIKIHKENSH